MASSSGTKGMMGEILNEDDATADSERVPSRLAFIAPILRIANEIEKDNPRVAYLCRFHAFEEVYKLYPTSSTVDADSRQFMTYFLRRLETDDEVTRRQLARTDGREIEMYYEQFYMTNIMEGQDIKKPEEMVKIYQTATVLYDVMRMVVPPNKIDSKMERYAEAVKRKWEKYEHYNILPLYAFGVKPAIMELPEIKVAVQAISNVEGLPMPMPRVHDILDWLSSLFGFQKGNVANQREHLILLLANCDVRGRSSKKKYLERELKSKTVTRLVDKIFENYCSWCNYLHCESNLRCQQGCNIQQLELIYISLYLLIWGEASNIRFMPECICYIFHNMANEVYGVVFSNVHPVAGDTYQAAPDDESFLRNVITPIYNVLQREVKRNKGGRASHSKWRNYDDLNEYFWSEKCFQLGWPMNEKADFFSHSDDLQLANERQNQTIVGQRKPKVNFVEARTFWHLFRSFDRMWIFFVMTFQAMLIVAWNSRSLLGFFEEDVFRSLLTIFITAAFLNFLQATLDIILSFGAWRSLKFSQRLRYLLKFAVAAIWAVVLPISYSSSRPNSTGLVKFFSSWARDWRSESFFSYAVSIYLIPNMLSALLFLLPPLRKSMERSNWRIITLIMWWAQPKLYVGGGMHEDFFSLMKYTVFWIVLIISKLAFSFYVEILPLIQPTKILINLHVENYRWHEFFKNVNHNIGVVIAIWAPVVLVYFVDTQIWYGMFSTLFGLIQGAFSHLGEIRTLGMLGSRFESLPRAFSRHLVPLKVAEAASFSLVWNKFIYSMRMEDLINNRERDLLLVPSSSDDVSIVQWPLFFLASKITIALDIAKDFEEKDDAELFKKIEADDCMHSAIIECYETLKAIMYDFLEDDADKWVITLICYEVEISIQQHRFLTDFRMSELPSLCDKLDKFLRLLLSDIEDVETFRSQIINVLHDIIQVVTQDVMVNGNEILQRTHPQVGTAQQEKKEQRFEKINISLIRQNGWQEKINRLDLLLTDKESSINVPLNLEALRRITFFANSLFMNMPRAPKVRDMLSFSVLTPYYREDVLYSDEDLNKENEDGISIVFYLQKIYPDEWNNFLERMKQDTNGIKDENEEARIEEETGKWVSYRGQTLSRTVRGMMYYRQALKLQRFLEFSGRSAILRGYEAFEEDPRYAEKSEALANMKFTYVVSCQVYGIQKKSDAKDRSRYTKILNLMLTYPSLRVAYIDETEEIVNGRSQSIYYSVLVKGGEMSDEEIYRIKLPGPPTRIGEGKPENQNHAIIFTRGEALQTIDMNQDNYFEEAYKMRNVLEEFIKTRRKKRKPSILGLREHTFTGSVSSLAWLVSNQQTSFATIGQRIVANPLRVRFHYGHADIFDRIFHITRGGISKASRVINLTGDIFAGFNSILRGGYVTHHEYIQVGKGRDVGMNQLSLFDTKVANGNGEQMLSRDVYRLGCRFDFYRMLSFYFTTVGFYFSSMVMVLTVYVFLYGRFYMVMSGLERTILDNATIQQSNALVEAFATQSVFQLGMLLVLPIVMEIGLEKGFRTALGDFIIMQLQLASVFFTFQLGTKAHYFGRTILHGGSRYRATGRGFVVIHAKFAENYRMYSRSHFVKGLELLILLVLYEVYGESYRSSSLYKFITFSMWFLVASWLFAPFVFNPSGFDWHKTVDDWKDWKSWMGIRGRIGFYPDESWESWWEEEQEHLKYTNIRGIVLEIILAFRFFIFQYGIVYHLDIAHSSKSLQVYGLSWVVMVTVLLVSKMVSMNRRRFGIDYQLTFRILKALLFLGFTTVMIVLVVVFGITISDLFASILAFLPTGWAILLIGQALRPVMECLGFWDSMKELARAYEYVMGLILFMPIAILSWFAVVSELQTRLLFNQAFTRGLAVD